ncbi:MAG: hypothetical protein J1E77_08850 [Prevotella sp.]|nr:hypothetical protein [Prevotella sp.]
MRRYTDASIKNNIVHALTEGYCLDDARASFLKMKMANDLGEEKLYDILIPTLKEICNHLRNNNGIANEEFCIEHDCIQGGIHAEGLVIKLSPIYRLRIERTSRFLRVIINNSEAQCISRFSAAEIATWIVRQKKNLDKYLQEWEEVFRESAKKVKGQHLAFLAIKAIFTEAMKDYPGISYKIEEQKRRARIKVRIPNSNLGVYIDGWWGSYQERLPQQIESLKALIDTQRNSAIKYYHTYKR